MVDRSAPNVSFWVAPPPTSTTSQCSTSFVLVTDEEAVSFDVQWRAVNASACHDGGVNVSVWRVSSSNTVSLTGLAAGASYVLLARATDVAGNVGRASSWRWSSGGCPAAASLAVALVVESYAVGNDSRAVMWSVSSALSRPPSEVQYRVNDGPWLRTTRYRVDVRPAVPCG
jgi:hypothetical protein